MTSSTSEYARRHHAGELGGTSRRPAKGGGDSIADNAAMGERWAALEAAAQVAPPGRPAAEVGENAPETDTPAVFTNSAAKPCPQDAHSGLFLAAADPQATAASC